MLNNQYGISLNKMFECIITFSFPLINQQSDQWSIAMNKKKIQNLIAATITAVPGIVIFLLNPIHAVGTGANILRWIINVGIVLLLFWITLDYSEKDYDQDDESDYLIVIIITALIYGLCGLLILRGIEKGFLRFIAFAVMWAMSGTLGRSLVPIFWGKPDTIISETKRQSDKENTAEEQGTRLSFARWGKSEYVFYCVPIVSNKRDVTGDATTTTVTTTKTYNMSNVTKHSIQMTTAKKLLKLRWIMGIISAILFAFFINGIIALFFGFEFDYALIWNVPPDADTLVLFIIDIAVILLSFWAILGITFERIVEVEMRRSLKRAGYRNFDVVDSTKWDEFKKKLSYVRKTY